MVQWCNPQTLQQEQSGGVGSKPGWAPPLQRHDKGSQTRLALATSVIPVLGAKNPNFTFTLNQPLGSLQDVARCLI